jgi:hypothetical protein
VTAYGYVGGDPSKLDADGYLQGDVPAANASGVLTPVAIGTPGNVLTVNAAQPEFLDYEPGGGGGGGVSSVFGRVGNVVAANGDYTAVQVGADASGAAAAVLATSAQKAQNLADLANVVTARTNLGLGNVDNTSDANKPVSTAQQTALNLKANLAGPTFTGTVGGITAAMVGAQPLDSDLTTIAGLASTTGNMIQGVANVWAAQTPAQVKTSLVLAKGDVGLGNVDNTSDANKPVSTAQQTALNLKANIASPTFTGTSTFARQVNTPVVLADAATILVNASLGNTFRMTLTTTGRTLGNPSSPVDGQMLLFELIQSAAGGLTLLLGTKFAFGTGITSFTMTSTADKRDFLGVFYNSTADKFFVIALAQGY